MRLDIAVPDDGLAHDYCWNCRAERVARAAAGAWECAACGERHERVLRVDPGLAWWTGPDAEYWHATAGVFVRRADGRLLLFDRTLYPYAWTVPAGHVDAGEDPAAAASRELREETGLHVPASRLRPLEVADMPGDSCWRGADAHRWHAFVADVPAATPATVREEGRDARWLTPDEALSLPVTPPVRALLQRHPRLGA
ncbi:NUDIX hydrolase [Actinomadura parmotrematis]|uniref:NUDIX hydrolase n=1 Tax=Actinomadura parmotrematis TaxID=2864039 RepID=A0ABS7FYU9_9ACTN|nr:NUDIX hydrolase [Actinomadura parmotrematis]MBW8485320.1 NUDIX hydrolase [Actinomadura parmotrematis]